MAEKPITIFYSWQSDLPNNKTRGFIQGCIEAAIKSLRETVLVEAQRDTVGILGTPDIVETIFSRIDNCDLFVADVTTVGKYIPITDSDRTKVIPNPNVMLELGYAAKTLGWNNVICIRNIDFGVEGELPFDLEHRRLTNYSLEREDAANVKRHIRDIIARTVMDIYENGTRIIEGYAMHTVGSFDYDTGEINKSLVPLDLRNRPKCVEKQREYLSNCKELIGKIFVAKVGVSTTAITEKTPVQNNTSNPVMKEWLETIRKEQPVILKKEEVDFIREKTLKYLDMELEDTFFSVGNLKFIPPIIPISDGNYVGSEEERQKYTDLQTLAYKYHELELIDIFLDTFKDIVLLPIAIHNVSTVSDEDITVIIQVNSEEVDIVIPSGALFNETYRSEGALVGLEGAVYDVKLPCMALYMSQTAHIQYDTDISFDIEDVRVENKRNVMRMLGSIDSQSDIEDYERELCKYIATPMREQPNAYKFNIRSLHSNETKWIGPLIALRLKGKEATLEYIVRSTKSNGQISGRLNLSII